MDKTNLTTFIIRCLWMTFALVIWIIALNMILGNNGTSDNYIYACLLTLIPIAWPIIKFVLKAAGVGVAVGSTRWDIDFSNGRIYNHGLRGGLIVGIIAIILCVVGGIFILPIYWIYYSVGTIRLGIETFRRH